MESADVDAAGVELKLEAGGSSAPAASRACARRRWRVTLFLMPRGRPVRFDEL